MRLPHIPLEINQHLPLYTLCLLHRQRPNLQQPIKVLTLIIVAKEPVVVFLRVELYNSRFAKLPILRRLYFYRLQHKELLEQVLQILLRNLQIQVIQITLVDVIILDNLLDLTTI